MQQLDTIGLPADWLNAWLAAVGVTVLCPGVRLSWSEDPVPCARFTWSVDAPLAALIQDALPPTDDLADLVFAELRHKIPLPVYQNSAQRTRKRSLSKRQGEDSTLAILATDLAEPDRDGSLPTGPFNIGVSRGETLFARLRRCRDALDDGDAALAAQIERTFAGQGRRVLANGLGFDYRRIAAPVPGEATKFVDPVIEVLAFFGLWLFPTGGDGRRLRARGWTGSPSKPGAFSWPAWRDPLDRWGIDSLLDLFYGRPPGSRLGRSLAPGIALSAVYGLVPFERTGQSDPTRGYGSERLV